MTGEKRDQIRAHWVFLGQPDDNGWTEAHERGRLQATAALGDRLHSGFTPNVSLDASATRLFEKLVDNGTDVIFAGTEYGQLLSNVAEANPGIKFVEVNGHTFLDNLFGFYLAHKTSAYLMGVAAAHLTDNGRLGYIGAFGTAAEYNDANGLLLGARSVNPDATVNTVLINSFFDPPNAARAADDLIDDGVEFLFGIMDEPTYLRVAEDAGVWTAYWSLDCSHSAPTRYVANYSLEAFGPFYTAQCQAVLDGTWFAPGSIVLLDAPLFNWGPNVPPDVRDAVAAAVDGFTSGELEIYRGPLWDNNGNVWLEDGEVVDAVGAYDLSVAVKGVTGL